ncbi:2-polyprenylphenol 6-hydroxylase [Candidatus Tokpelaia sp.]|uniref:2-polyprenylphenol 6-hydroxylase n=1 Tax=Candidatus Tokpelaia sp. TaxID=2233777 RepID=UPI00123AEDB3|nr:2-polyprenylphenol 6-hydroxylase [Candidatus Tokpelaia sp.]KAA6406032.1 2-polyprenylphenol 6-hydroxylase [Candidatus Tokpelaia sp.]
MSRFTASLRLVRAGYVLAREGVFAALPVAEAGFVPVLAQKLARLIARRGSRRQHNAEPMSRAMNRLGPFYVKLGQFLATRPDIVGQKAARDLSALQDRVKPFAQNQAVLQVETTLNRPIDQIFDSFGAPIAAASMAQVHEAVVPAAGGRVEKRAVKVIRPHLRRAFARNMESFYLAAHMAEKYVSYMRRLRPVKVVENLEQTTKIEMDMRLEAAALSEMAENIAKGGDKGFRVPKVDWERTGRDCLTMEWVEGIRISEREALLAAGHNVEQLAAALMQTFLSHALRDGFFHADMHPGNLFVDDSGTIIAVDLGITGRLGKKEKRFLAEILYGFITRDYYRVARVHFEAGYVPDHHSVESFAQANRAIGEPIYGQSVETISMARLLGLLFEITELFNMQTRPELLLLQKNMVVVEGVARALDPHFNMWKVAEPVVGAWVAQNLGVAGAVKDMAESARAVVGFARALPELGRRFDHISKALQRQAEHGFKLDKASLLLLAQLQARQNRFLRLALWGIGLILLIGLAHFW